MIPFNPFFSMELHFLSILMWFVRKRGFVFLSVITCYFLHRVLFLIFMNYVYLFICLFIFLELAESLSVNWRGSVQICIYSVNLNIKIPVQEILQAVMTNSNAVMADERNHRITISALSIVSHTK